MSSQAPDDPLERGHLREEPLDFPVIGEPAPAAGASTAPEQPSETAPKKGARVAFEWLAILAVAVLAAFLIRTFAIEPFYIPSGSMEPTLHVHDRVLVNKLSYDAHAVHRGDVVVFTKPADDVSPGVKDLIKRVIGLPGETISTQQGHVYINGHQLAEPWLPKTQIPVPEGGCTLRTQRIPASEYFVMGDNRGDSSDSRCFGPIPGKLIIGRAFVRVWPLSHLGGL